MIDFRKAFENSFKQLKNNKVVVAPLIISTLGFLILIILFTTISGLNPFISEMMKMDESYESKQMDYLTDTNNINDDDYLMELLYRVSGRNYESENYDVYLDQNLQGDKYDYLFNTTLFVRLGIFVLIGILFGIYMNVVTLSTVSEVIKKKKIKLSNILKKSNELLFRYIGVGIIICLYVILPIILIGLISGLLSAISEILGIIFIILGVLITIVYLVYISLKLFFVMQSLFLDETTTFKSIKSSFNVTNKKLLQVFISGVMIAGLSMISKSYIGNSAFSMFADVIWNFNIISFIPYLIVMVVLYLIYLSSLAFINLFKFNIYIDFKKKGGRDGKK